MMLFLIELQIVLVVIGLIKITKDSIKVNHSLVHINHSVCLRQKLYGMSDQNSSLIREVLHYGLF